MRFLVAVGVMLGFAAGVRADTDVRSILDNATQHEGDKKVLEESLGKLDQWLVKHSEDPDGHYARGWVLAHLGRPAEAITAYKRALVLHPRFGDAAYNAGVVYGGQKKDREAIVYFDKAFAIEPTNVDAAYNAGQSYYNIKDYGHAAARWAAAQKLAPDDFAVAKKLVQAYHALGKEGEAAKARDKVLALYKEGKGGKAKDFVFDQFDVGKRHVYAAETFDTSGDLAYVYRFDVTLDGNRLGSVNLETSAVIREAGLPYLLAMDKDGTHAQLGKSFKAMPAYKDLKPMVIEVIKAKF